MIGQNLVNLYADLTRTERIAAGYFEPEDEKPFGKFVASKKTFFYEDFHVLYYPGSFGTFHAGHLRVAEEAYFKSLMMGEDPIIVVAPANSDYAAKKYGKWSKFASNKHRYDAIKDALNNSKIIKNWDIDINPMMNFRNDINFTDLFQYYIKNFRRGVDIDSALKRASIICGKDRAGFDLIRKNGVDVRYFEDVTGASTSDLLTEKHLIQKKTAVVRLRAKDIPALEKFKSYFGDEYVDIHESFIEDEIETARRYYKNGVLATICKDYQNVMSYAKISRGWVNPLEASSCYKHVTEMHHFRGLDAVLDSDCYTGGTAKYMKEHFGVDVIPILDFRGDTDFYDIIDMDDFLNGSFTYPNVDISSRCSMSAFTYDTHLKFDEFIKEINALKEQ